MSVFVIIATYKRPEHLKDCLSSTFKNSYIILEAMACGKAVIVSPCGGSRGILRDGENGLLVLPRAKELADKMSFLIENKDKREKLRRMAGIRIKRSFNWEERGREWMAYYLGGQ